MAKLLYGAATSLDGFIAGVGGDMSWMSGLPTASPALAADLPKRVGSLLVGARTFGGDDPNKGTESEGAFGGTWHGPSFVVTHHPPAEPVPDVTFFGELRPAVEAARIAAGDRYVNILGADIGRQCLEAGLVDEIVVFAVPILLGDGIRLFDHPGGTRIPLEPLHLEPGVLWYRVPRP